MKLRWLNEFIVIAEKGSINKAAETLFISQPTLSKNLKSLENELNVSLFKRLKTGVQLTQHGRAFLPYATKIKCLLEEFEVGRKTLTSSTFFLSKTVNFTLTPILFQTFYETIDKNLSIYFKNVQFMIMELNKPDAVLQILDRPNTVGLVFSPNENANDLPKEIIVDSLYKTPIATYTKSKNFELDPINSNLYAIATGRGYLSEEPQDVKLITNNLEIIRHKLEHDDNFFISLPQIIAAREILPLLSNSVQSYASTNQGVSISLMYHKDVLSGDVFPEEFIEAMKSVILRCLIS